MVHVRERAATRSPKDRQRSPAPPAAAPATTGMEKANGPFTRAPTFLGTLRTSCHQHSSFLPAYFRHEFSIQGRIKTQQQRRIDSRRVRVPRSAARGLLRGERLRARASNGTREESLGGNYRSGRLARRTRLAPTHTPTSVGARVHAEPLLCSLCVGSARNSAAGAGGRRRLSAAFVLG